MISLLGNSIEIKHPGAFTEYCKRKGYKSVTCECICEGMKSNDPDVRKRANFETFVPVRMILL